MTETAASKRAASTEALTATLNAGLDADESRIARARSECSEEYAREVLDLPRMGREVRAKRDLIAAILSQPHRQVEDGWYSCAQAADDDDPEPGSACLDEDRAGGPCDCGRDARVERLLSIMAGIYEEPQP